MNLTPSIVRDILQPGSRARNIPRLWIGNIGIVHRLPALIEAHRGPARGHHLLVMRAAIRWAYAFRPKLNAHLVLKSHLSPSMGVFITRWLPSYIAGFHTCEAASSYALRKAQISNMNSGVMIGGDWLCVLEWLQSGGWLCRIKVLFSLVSKQLL
jgi:hypothetical protein